MSSIGSQTNDAPSLHGRLSLARPRPPITTRCSEPPRGNQEHWDSSQGQMTTKQSCSLAFQS
eukprot:scaffold90267_cov35-Cyclotella_meneghiniana.AAC.2